MGPAGQVHSGTAVYRKTFDLDESTASVAKDKKSLYLDLGTVNYLARVRLNGIDLGILWTAPWRVDITDAVKAKSNELEIEVVLHIGPGVPRCMLDGPLGSGASLLVTNLSTGAHTITASVTDSGGLSTTVTATLNVFADTNVILAAGDIADCDSNNSRLTAQLLATIPGTVFTVGDNAYENGTSAQFANCYDPSWGKYKDRTKLIPGNHEYHTSGAAGYSHR